MLPRRNQKQITSLIEEFQYPKYGPGMMWERCRDVVEAAGTKVIMDTAVTRVIHRDGMATAVVGRSADGSETDVPVFGGDLLHAVVRPAGLHVAARPRRGASGPPDGLHYRDFLTVALVVPECAGFPDNWIYIHSPDVKLGRIQNFGSWSPYLVKEGRTCLGLEYFVFEGDEYWTMPDDELVKLGNP